MYLTQKSSYFYKLPNHLIAQTPMQKRDDCRLLYVPLRNDNIVYHKNFKDIVSLLKPNDVLVINTSKVIPARLTGYKKTGGKVEILLLRELTAKIWECLVKPASRLKNTDIVYFNDKSDATILKGKIIHCKEEGIREIEFSWADDTLINKNNSHAFETSHEQSFISVIDNIGQVPLPPYIKRDSFIKDSQTKNKPLKQNFTSDKEYYQTVYAQEPGSAAAPTAGLHFTEELLEELTKKGIIVTNINLHIGIDTFRPVKVDNILEHKIHREFCTVPIETSRIINQALDNKQRIIAVGTTVTRTLESFAVNHYKDNVKVKRPSSEILNNTYRITPGSKWTDLFIYPGYEFKIINGLLTNFHLPESSLLMLVTAFGGYSNIINAYQKAVEEEYRFFSYGDAMLIV